MVVGWPATERNEPGWASRALADGEVDERRRHRRAPRRRRGRAGDQFGQPVERDHVDADDPDAAAERPARHDAARVGGHDDGDRCEPVAALGRARSSGRVRRAPRRGARLPRSTSRGRWYGGGVTLARPGRVTSMISQPIAASAADACVGRGLVDGEHAHRPAGAGEVGERTRAGAPPRPSRPGPARRSMIERLMSKVRVHRPTERRRRHRRRSPTPPPRCRRRVPPSPRRPAGRRRRGVRAATGAPSGSARSRTDPHRHDEPAGDRSAPTPRRCPATMSPAITTGRACGAPKRIIIGRPYAWTTRSWRPAAYPSSSTSTDRASDASSSGEQCRRRGMTLQRSQQGDHDRARARRGRPTAGSSS